VRNSLTKTPLDIPIATSEHDDKTCETLLRTKCEQYLVQKSTSGEEYPI